MKQKMLFIYNPWAGKHLIKNRLTEVLDLFVQNGYEVTIHPTQKTRDAYELAMHQAKHYDILVCSGGDGTLSEVVDGLMMSKHHPILGYIPSGSTNDFATSLRLYKDIGRAAQTVVDGMPYLCDVGQFNGRSFIYVAAFGAFTDVPYQTPLQRKHALGHLAYLLEGVKRLPSLEPCSVHVEYDGNVIEDEILCGMVSNSNSIGGFQGLSGKGVHMDDGLFEVTLFKAPKNPMELQGIVNGFLTRNHNKNLVYQFRTQRLTLSFPTSTAWTLDGEFGGAHQEVSITNRKHALAILKPAKKR